MNVYDVLVGDIVKVDTGEIMSVDGIFTECHEVSMDESSMTGTNFGLVR